jgi:protein-L-isoaspartate(D-aspartate) O-methyltransferase
MARRKAPEPPGGRASLAEVKRFYAKLMAAASNSADPRLEDVFADVPREAFMPPGPWRIMVNQRYFETPSADPAYLYQNALVALDADKGVNNGEPFLHAGWIGAVAPKPGDVICHIGAGTGYYTAVLSRLAFPGGRVEAFEIDADLAEKARANLASFDNVILRQNDATKAQLPDSDLIYVNAGVVAPPLSWLKALRPGGRMILPWRPTREVGLAIVVTRLDAGFAVKPLTPAWFIPCVGASDADDCVKAPNAAEAFAARSIWPIADRAPDETAAAIYKRIWFSSSAPRAQQASTAPRYDTRC